MSFNIRWASPADGKNVWDHRKDMAAEVIASNDIGIAGLQEALAGQLADLKERLPNYASVGVGRDDGKEAGEFAPILYDRERFEVEKSGTFWLSENPGKPGSMSWDTACTRIATWGIFRVKESGERLFVLNTHLDHRSELARVNGAKLIAKKVSELSEGLPVVVTGDFNATSDSPPLKALIEENLYNARVLGNMPSMPTFNGFGKAEDAEEIDHILVSGEIEVTDYRILKIERDGVSVSDHWPVCVTIKF